jgi:hypothetical protein
MYTYLDGFELGIVAFGLYVQLLHLLSISGVCLLRLVMKYIHSLVIDYFVRLLVN